MAANTTAAPTPVTEAPTEALPTSAPTPAPTAVPTPAPTPAPDPCPVACKAAAGVKAGNVTVGGQPLVVGADGGNRCSYTVSGGKCGMGAAFSGVNSTDCGVCVAKPPTAPCVVQGYFYSPHTTETVTAELGWEACQLRCAVDVYCKFFGYWPDHGCMVSGSEAELYKGAPGCVDAKNCAATQVISGPDKCGVDYYSVFPNTAGAKDAVLNSSGAVAPGNCTVNGYVWTPQASAGDVVKEIFGITLASDCQTRCSLDTQCKKFTFWPNAGKCDFQFGNASLVQAMCNPAKNETGCNTVVAGAQACTSDNWLWFPVIGNSGGTGVVVVPKSAGAIVVPAPVPAPVPSPVPVAGTTLAPITDSEGGGGGPNIGLIVGGLVLVGAIAAAVLYGLGFFGGEEKKKKKSDKKKKSNKNRDVDSEAAEAAALMEAEAEKPLPTTTAGVPAYAASSSPMYATGGPSYAAVSSSPVVGGSPIYSGSPMVSQGRAVYLLPQQQQQYMVAPQ